MSNEHAPIETLEDILDALPKQSFYDTHVSLGGEQRIKRGAMNTEQINRRRLVIAGDDAYSGENRWLDIAANALKGTPPETKIMDVLPEDMGEAAVNMEARAELEGRQNGHDG